MNQEKFKGNLDENEMKMRWKWDEIIWNLEEKIRQNLDEN
jgi:hypothetical protein